MKKPQYKRLAKRRRRTLIENSLTLAIWAVWIWSASRAAKDWHLLHTIGPIYLTFLKESVIGSGVLMLVFWVRSKYSLELPEDENVLEPVNPKFEDKCLSLVGWNRKELVVAQQARSFSVSMANDLKCTMSATK